ncbi:MFS transporter [Streptomyces sp. NPDC058733]|uniref:MFS transporter n=1 Tax=unclassified Streptomyces TaxID=2593676 RepID=UPI003452893A
MTTSTQPGRSGTRTGPALATLALGAFVIGTAELVIVGILNLIAKDTDVSVGTAGLLVTAYALGICVGGPLLTAVTIKLGRHLLLWSALAVFLAANALAAATSAFGVLVLARVVSGAVHGLFIGVASALAAHLVPPGQQGRAVAMVFGGIAVSTVIGVPLGTLVGQQIGWQATFAGIVALTAVALVATLVLVPRVGITGPAGLGSQARHAFAPRVLAQLGVGLLLLGGQFAAFTYLASYLEDVTGISGGVVSAFLLVYGVASAVGVFGGGRFADRGAARTLVVANLALALILTALHFVGKNPALTAVALAVWGLVGFGLVPSFQLRVISLAGPGGDLAATLGASAVNAGIAGGAAVGGWAVESHGVDSVVVLALTVMFVALPATWAASRWLRPPAAEPTLSETPDTTRTAATDAVEAPPRPA